MSETWRSRRQSYGQKRPSLTVVLKRILEGYPDGGQILKELIQNADDAGATEVKFLFDSRDNAFGTTSLIDVGLSKFQGPALYVYNNGLFTEKDWIGIESIMQGSKKRDPVAAGRFGIGFNSVYHVTVFAGYNDITPLYSIHSPRNFSPSLLGYFLAEVSFMKGVGVVLVIPFLTKILSWSDLTIAIVGVFLSIMFYIFLAFASTKLLMFIAGLTAFGSGMSPPCLRSVLSKQVESSELGTMFALVASLEVLETLLGSVIFNNIYSTTVDWNPGFCYFLMPAMLVVPIALMIWLYILQRRDTPYIAMDTGDRSQSPEDSINADEAINKSSNGSQYGSQVSTA